MYQRIVAALLFVMVLLGAYMVVSASRVEQLIQWKEAPQELYVGETPLVTTLDAYSWGRIADEHNKGIYEPGTIDPLGYYPDGMLRLQHTPLISLLLAKLALFFDTNVYQAGLFIFPFLAGLFLIPLSILMYRMRAPAAGILGGLLGSFSIMYIVRTDPGRIDTDSINLFFIFMTPLLIHIASDRKKSWQVLLWSALAGFSQFLFSMWYFHYMFILVFLGVLCAVLFLNKQSIKTIIIAAVIYILCSGPHLFAESFTNLFALLKAYIFSQENISGGFPNVYQTVTEASKHSYSAIINNYFMHPVVFALALTGLGLWALRNWRGALVLAPVAILAFMPFVSGVRFVMYMVPFLGLGLGYIVSEACNKIKAKIWIQHTASYLIVLLFVFLIVTKVPVGYLYTLPVSPSITPSIYSGIRAMGKTLPAKSAIYTWWDYGLAIEAEAGLATFHDGMSQNTIKTWLIARSFVDNQEEAYRYISYISRGLSPVIQKVNSGQITAKELVDEIDAYNEPLENEHIYVAFTQDMVSKYGAIQHIGNWDVINSKYIEGSFFTIVDCGKTTGMKVSCDQGFTLDLAVGILNKTPVASIDYVDLTTGMVTHTQETEFKSDVRAIVLTYQDNIVALGVAEEKVYRSSFVQMYILGKINPALYKEVLNIYPVIRVFYVLPEADVEAAEEL